jgi:hypothetical protein
MVYNTQNGRVLDSVHRPVLERIQRFGNWSCFRPKLRGETPTLLGPVERVNLNHWSKTLRSLVFRIPEGGQISKTQ